MSKLSAAEIERMAVEIRDLLLKEQMWMDVTIYFNGKAFATSDGTRFAYNDPTNLIVLEDRNPADYMDYYGGVIDMSFEGYFYEAVNCGMHKSVFKKFRKILNKNGCYWTQGHAWSLSIYENEVAV